MSEIICPECGKVIKVDTLVLFYGIPFDCPHCKATLISK